MLERTESHTQVRGELGGQASSPRFSCGPGHPLCGLVSGESVPQEISPALPCPPTGKQRSLPCSPIGKQRSTEFIFSTVSAVTIVKNPQQLGPRVTRDAALDIKR